MVIRASKEAAITVTNVSASTSALSLAMTGVGFRETDTCTATLEAGASCVVTIPFCPDCGRQHRVR
jgi:hypothetical protein